MYDKYQMAVGPYNVTLFMFLADEPANLRICFGYLEGLERDFQHEMSRIKQAQSNVPREYHLSCSSHLP
jgi:hypothetical protein